QLMACKGQRKIASLTAYSAPFARILDEVLDMILIGDSTAMVGYAMPDTLSFTIDQIAAHTAAVVRSTQRACIVADMPFGSYQESPQQAFANAAKLLASGAAAVKMEGGRSEEHTSELQSRENLVCRLLLEKKKNSTVPEHKR